MTPGVRSSGDARGVALAWTEAAAGPMDGALEIGQAVELMGVENAGLDISGKRGMVTEMPASGLVTVKIEGSSGEVVSVWPENLKILKSTQVTGENK